VPRIETVSDKPAIINSIRKDKGTIEIVLDRPAVINGIKKDKGQIEIIKEIKPIFK
jgi:hypothetical protein